MENTNLTIEMFDGLEKLIKMYRANTTLAFWKQTNRWRVVHFFNTYKAQPNTITGTGNTSLEAFYNSFQEFKFYHEKRMLDKVTFEKSEEKE